MKFSEKSKPQRHRGAETESSKLPVCVSCSQELGRVFKVLCHLLEWPKNEFAVIPGIIDEEWAWIGCVNNLELGPTASEP